MTTDNKSKQLVKRMIEALNDHVIEGQDAFWAEKMKWRGPAGAGLKRGLKHFQEGWQRPFLKAFPDKEAHDEIFIAEGDYIASSGYVSGTHRGEFMGIPPTGKKIRLRYMDFWKVEGDRIVDNWVLLDIIDVMRQMGVDPLQGQGWDEYGEEYADD